MLPGEPSNPRSSPSQRAARTPSHNGAGSGLRRHFEGYELGLATVGMVLTFALLALPRPSEPMTLPLPQVDRAEARRGEQAAHELATRAETEGLPFEVRAVGEAIRHLGRSSTEGLDVGHDEEDIRARVKRVDDAKLTPLLLRLRAVQAEYFWRALEQFEHDGKQSRELAELGGDFVDHAQKVGWFDAHRRLVADQTTTRILFQMRWADLVGKRAVFPFAPSLNEWRIYYRFLLLRPEHSNGSTDPSAEAAVRLRVVNALSKKDPDYPTEVAQGFLLFQLGDTDGAASAYRLQLAKHESGPYALLSRNYLIYTLQGISSE